MNPEDLSVEEICCWLIDRVSANEERKMEYAAPYYNYVATWHRALPLRALIIAQNPYPTNIFTVVSAALSYSEELCQAAMRKRIPPSVEVLANDLYVNAKLDRQAVVDVIRQGWELVDSGVLIINEAVFGSNSDVATFKEGVYQCTVVTRMLRETERMGGGKVDIFALGAAGERMAGNISSWFKSPSVKISVHKAPNPAAVARDHEDLASKECNLGSPHFSKLLAKHIGNNVAVKHVNPGPSTMPPKYDPQAQLRQREYSDAVNTAARVVPETADAIEIMIAMGKEHSEVAEDPAYKETLDKFIAAMEVGVIRLGIMSASLRSVGATTSAVSGTVAKQGPSLALVAPSPTTASMHAGKLPSVASPRVSTLAPRPVPAPVPVHVRAGSSVPSTGTTVPLPTPVTSSVVTSTATGSQDQGRGRPMPQARVAPSRVPSVAPVPTVAAKQTLPATRVATPVRSPVPAKPQSATPVRSPAPVRAQAAAVQHKISTATPIAKATPTSVAAVAASARSVADVGGSASQKVHDARQQSPSPAPRNDQGSETATDQHSISKDMVTHLSSIEALVSIFKKTGLTRDDADEIEALENDMQWKRSYNATTKTLVDAISKDIERDPHFSVFKLTLDDKACISSYTYAACREIFEF